jgi:chemosensory pili system protein ChpA (sensor histidine kinase/response regulator)
MSEVADQTLQAVATEIGATLGDARSALEAYAERMADPAPLATCAIRLHEVFGVLRVIEVHGAALLAEEMEFVARFLSAAPPEIRNQPEGLDPLMRAMVQLPAYLERVLAGGRDVPLVLLPLLNDLRAVRGQALLSEGTLLLLNLTSDRQPEPSSNRAGETPMDVAQWAGRLRPRFQVALLGVLRGERIPQHLEVLAQIAERLEKTSKRQPVFQLWWVVGAVLEALRSGNADGAATLKRLLGQVDREMKRLHEVGEARYAETPPVDLLNNLLYFVARTPATGDRITAVRASFRLQDLLPVSAEVEDQRASLSAPSVKLMETVGAAIKEDLARVKDALDIFVRSGGAHVSDLSGQTDLLRKIGDTLGVLGLAESRAIVQEQLRALDLIISSGATPATDNLIDIAAALIRVEDSLEPQLVGMILPKEPSSTTAPIEATDAEFRQVQAAVLRECIVNLAHIKEAFAATISGHDGSGAAQVPNLIRGIAAGLMMLGRTRAIEIFERIGRHVAAVVTVGADSSSQRLDRLADAIVSIEYYMETLQSGRSEPLYMLDNAEACLRVLESALPAPAVPASVTPVNLLSTAPLEMPSEKLSVEPSSGVESVDESGVYRAVPQKPAPVPAAAPDSIANAISAEVDPDLVELFIEEAREELPKIHDSLQAWDLNPLDDEALTRLRRSFHTLKGSGRMVGARLVGDYAWAIENLLNRIISGTRTRTASLLGVLRDAVAGLPALIDQLETRQPPTFGVADLMNRLHGLSEGRDAEPASEDSDEVAGRDESEQPATQFGEPSPWMIATSVLLTAEPPQAAVKPEPASSTPLEVPDRFVRARDLEVPPDDQDVPLRPSLESSPADHDGTLVEIYRAEVVNHISAIRAWVAARDGRQAPHAVTDDLYRACHTLAGASRMAGMAQGTELAEPLNLVIRRFHDQGNGLPDEAISLLLDYADAFSQVADPAQLPRLSRDQTDALQSRLMALEAASSGSLDTPPVEVADEMPVQHSSAVDMATTGSFATIDFDPEIATIFSEEASELLESAARAIDRLEQNSRDVDALTALKRYLHTLKGGARMAGVPTMGELAHEFESLLTRAESFGSLQSNDLVPLLVSGLDAFESMRRTVQDGRPAEPATDIVARIRAASAPSPQLPTLRASDVEQPEPQLTAAAEPLPVVEPPLVTEVARGSMSPLEPGVLSESSTSPREADRASSEPASDIGEQKSTIPTESAAPVSMVVVAAAPAPESDLSALSPASPPREDRQDLARVDAELLDSLLNGAGEVSIQRARLEQQLTGVDANLGELARVVSRLRDQLRKLEIETEAQILHRYDDERKRDGFDPLEMDRYSTLQQYSRALAESASDVASIQSILEGQLREAQGLLTQQARVVTDLQNGLMRTRMVPFQRHIPRLTRIVRQAAVETGKQVELVVTGATGELDRQVLERMLAPFEHMLRNAVVHGIESPERRHVSGKANDGRIEMSLRREGSEVVIVVQDDGAGLDLAAIRAKAVSLGLVNARQTLSDADAMQLILEPGFSTASVVTQSAGRGVGMDVVTTEVKRLGGSLRIDSTPGQGTRFTIRLPFTLAVSQALILRAGTEIYALPLPTVESVVRLPKSVVLRHLNEDVPTWSYGDQTYAFRHLGLFIGGRPSELPAQDVPVPVVLIRAGDSSTAVVADELVGSREIVIKNVGPLVASIRGIAGATMLGDGRIVVILDLGALVRGDWRSRVYGPPDEERADRRTFALVVDDSITVRRVTQRLLERNGMRVVTARDGIEALAILQDQIPDVILLDIEMPRMDGYEVAARIRADERLKQVPIVMITSRVGEKHRARAIEIGVDDYLGKPYQESQLLDAIEPLVSRGRTAT